VHVPPRSEEISEPPENFKYSRGVYMMEKTVKQNKIIRSGDLVSRTRNIRHQKLSFIPPSCHPDVSLVDIDSQIPRMSEVAGVAAGTAADVENIADVHQIVMFENALKLLPLKWDLGNIEQQGLFKKIVEGSHPGLIIALVMETTPAIKHGAKRL